MKTTILMVLSFMLVACSTATPGTPTSTPIPYAEVDLNSLIINLKDLPADITEGPQKPMPGMYAALPRSANEAYKPLVRNGELPGALRCFYTKTPKMLKMLIAPWSTNSVTMLPICGRWEKKLLESI